MNKLVLGLFLFLSAIGFSQQAKISGIVYDSETKEGLPFAQVELIEKQQKMLCDVEGKYQFSQLEPGTYSLKFSYEGLETGYSPKITIKANEEYMLDFTLKPIVEDSISEIIITAKKKLDNDQGVLLIRKEAVNMNDVVSSQSIAKSTASNTSDVLKMVSGVSIQENKFAVIRGLNDRYNTAFINQAPLPSSESDRKAFSFEVFPSNMLENLIISKTASADLPAEFAGGIIQINTKSIPDKRFISFQLGTGLNSITTFKSRTTYQGGKTDWIGIDDGSRAFSKQLPAVGEFPLSMHDQAKLAQHVRTNWGTSTSKFLPNISGQLSGGYFTKFKKNEFGFIAGLSYSRSFEFTETERNGYTNSSSGDVAQKPQIDYSYLDKNYGSKLLAGAFLNTAFKFNDAHTIEWKNTASINSTDKVIQRTGEINPLEANPNLLRSNANWFTSDRVYATQLSGKHLFEQVGLKLDWMGSYSAVSRTVPTISRSIYTRNKTFIDPGNPDWRDTTYMANISFTNVGPSYGGGMFSSQNNEKSYHGKVDLTYSFKLFRKVASSLKVGYYAQYREREFEARVVGYTRYGVTGGAIKFDNSLLYLPEDSIFAPQNMGIIKPSESGNPALGGFKLTDGTKVSDRYTANSTVHAGYIQVENTLFKQSKLVYGVRMEHFNQQLFAKKDDLSDLELNTVKIDFLPSLNTIFNLTSRQSIRFSYSQTINRPEYRELAPFAFYDFTTNLVVSGNDTLKRAKINNLDLRYDTYFGYGQMFSATVFFKHFANPIEQVSRPDVVNEITYKNAPKAINFGLELEGRTRISTMLGLDTASFLKDFTLYANLAFIHSKVDTRTIVGSSEDSRMLQGQSPYIINAGIRYEHPRYQFGVALNVNKIGDRIYVVGNVNEPSLWEKSRTFLDLQLTKSFWRNRIQLKLNVQNILAQKQLFYQNGTEYRKAGDFKGFFNTLIFGDKHNKNSFDSKYDQQIWKTRFGSSVSFSVSFKF